MIMKKLSVSIGILFMLFSLTAQKSIVDAYVEGGMEQKDFVEAMTTFFQKYDLDEQQTLQIGKLLKKKSENYQVIMDLKTKDEELYERKLEGQEIHTLQYLKFILNQEQYRQYMMDYRVEKAGMKTEIKKK